MVFSSITFLFWFLPALLILYAIVPKKLKNAVMILGSFVFYSWGELRFLPVLVALSIGDYNFAKQMEKHENEPKKRKIFLILSVVCNLAVLGFFKYTNFIVGSVCSLLNLGKVTFNIILPVGVSFNCFQSISYTADVYRHKTKAEKSYYNYLTYTTLFPQIVAGPIVRYVTVGDDLDDHRLTIDSVSTGFRRFTIGLAKKVLIANRIGELCDSIMLGQAGEMTVLLYWMGIIAYTFQIYYDFSGYSDMAIGLAKMFGFKFDENFDYPYISKTITEFWRRWHMTLGSWFRDYVYIPLGGNRVSKFRNIINLVIVWGLTGLWHGASWNFVLWGLYFGVLLIIEKFLLKKYLDKLPSFFGHLYTMFFVVLGWVLFYFEDMSLVFDYIKGMFGFNGVKLYDTNALYMLVGSAALFFIAAVFCCPILKGAYEATEQSDKTVVHIISTVVYLSVFALCIAYLVNATYNPFLYFRF